MRSTPLLGALAMVLALAATACSSGQPTHQSSSATHQLALAGGTPTAAASTTPSTGRVAGHLAPPRVVGVAWVPAGELVRGVPAAYVARADHGQVSLLWLDPTLLRFRYVPGTKFPEAGPTQAIDKIPSTWVPRMVAAFNGGFELKDSAGGYYYAGSDVRPLRSGLAAMEVNGEGRLSVGVWGRDLSLSSSTVVVRENLRPLIDLHVSRAVPSDSPSAWGQANGSLIHANRSALAQLDDGSLVFAYGHEVRAWQMGAALVQVHAAEAVMLDMNKSWPGGFTYTHRGAKATGRRIDPAMYHTGSIYLTRFTKDFVVAMAVSP